MHKSYVLFDVTWRKNGGLGYFCRYFDQEHFETNQYFDQEHFISIRNILKPTSISIRNILKPTRSLYESYGSNSGFHDFGDIDLWPMFYFLSHALGMKYLNLHAKFHKNRSSING